MAIDIHGKRIAFLATDGVEEVEYTEPRKAVENAGGTAELISIKDGAIQAVNHLDKAGTYAVDRLAKDAAVTDYDALVLPGGVANPDFLRADPDAVRFVRDLPRAVDAGRGGCRRGPDADQLAQLADRCHQRRSDLGGRGGPRRRGAGDQPQAG